MSPRAVKSKRKKATAKKKAVRKRPAKKKVAKKKTTKKVKKKVVKKAAAPAKRAEARVGKTAKKKKTPKKATRPSKRAAKPALSADELRARRAARAAYRKLLRQSTQRLQAKRQSLIQAYNNNKGNTRNPAADGTEDYIDYAVSSYDRDFMLSLTEMERKQLMLVEDALRRIQRKEYGKCLQCGQEIPAPRLEVEPWARHCIRCQELEEQGLLDELPDSQGDEGETDDGEAADDDDEADEELDEESDEDEEMDSDDEDDDDEEEMNA